jgi:RNA polymerase sigma-70 factor (ECF subfamily)
MQENSPDPYHEFVRFYTRSEPDIRAFVRSLMPTWTDADEVLQQTALVLWKKFDQFDTTGDAVDFVKWACVIARFESLTYRRKMARDRLVFRDNLLEMMADEYVEELDGRQREHAALEQCLTDLPPKQSELVRLAYTPGVKIKDVAAEWGASSASFYMRLNRLRKTLLRCIQTRITEAPA